MKIHAAAIVFSLMATPAAATATDICEAVALHATTETKDFPYALKRGEIINAVTQYNVNKKTSVASLCQHGGGCYPAEALRLTNCIVQSKSSSELDDDVFYGLDVIRSKVPPDALRQNDVEEKLLDLGMCRACASNAAAVYVRMPASRCAKLVQQALEGDPTAIENVKDKSDLASGFAAESCEQSDVVPPALAVQGGNDGVVAGLVLLSLLIALYFLPSIVAFYRKRYNTGAIFVLNLFLGWTIVFWVLSLVWAVSNTGERAR